MPLRSDRYQIIPDGPEYDSLRALMVKYMSNADKTHPPRRLADLTGAEKARMVGVRTTVRKAGLGGAIRRERCER